MKISPFSTFRTEDFGSQKEWIDTLFLPLNNVLSQITQAMGGQITFGDNIPSFTKVLSGSNLSLPQKFQIDSNLIPTQMSIGQALKDGSPISMLGAWASDGDTITLSQLFEVSASGNAAIDSSAKYQITLRFT